MLAFGDVSRTWAVRSTSRILVRPFLLSVASRLTRQLYDSPYRDEGPQLESSSSTRSTPSHQHQQSHHPAQHRRAGGQHHGHAKGSSPVSVALSGPAPTLAISSAAPALTHGRSHAASKTRRGARRGQPATKR